MWKRNCQCRQQAHGLRAVEITERGVGVAVSGVTSLPSAYTRPYCVTRTFYFHNPYAAFCKNRVSLIFQLLTENFCIKRCLVCLFVRYKHVPTADKEIMLSQKVRILKEAITNLYNSCRHSVGQTKLTYVNHVTSRKAPTLCEPKYGAANDRDRQDRRTLLTVTTD